MSPDLTLQKVFTFVLPEIVLVGGACLLFLLAAFTKLPRIASLLVALIVLMVSASVNYLFHIESQNVDDTNSILVTVSPVLNTAFSQWIRLTAVGFGLILALMFFDECEEGRTAEFLACLLVTISGVSLVGAANDLIVLFLGLELISIPTYVMLYLPKTLNAKAQESALKYFMLSVVSSAFLLFGFSYLYGTTGTTNIEVISKLIPRYSGSDLGNQSLIAFVLILTGIGFRITAFPFHFYAPDVYEGGPSGPVAFLSFIPKLAGFAALWKLIGFVGEAGNVAPDFTKRVMMMVWILAAVSMTAGNVMALLQTNLRRMLAYSGVANTGYMLIGLSVWPAQSELYRTDGYRFFASGGDGILVYLVAYGAMSIGTLALLAYLHSDTRPVRSIDDLAGLGQSQPTVAFLLAVLLLSFIGLPLTAGFAGKLLLFLSAMAAPPTTPLQELFRVLALIGAINAAIASFYYLRVIMALYLRTPLQPVLPSRSVLLLVVGIICVIMTLGFGIYPWPLIQSTRWAAFSL